MATATIGSAPTAVKMRSPWIPKESIPFRKSLWAAVQIIIEFLVGPSIFLIFLISTYCIDKLCGVDDHRDVTYFSKALAKYWVWASNSGFWDCNSGFRDCNSGFRDFNSGFWDFKAEYFKLLRRSEDSRPNIRRPIIPRSEKPLLTPAPAQKHAKPIHCRTSCCSGNQVYYQQDLPNRTGHSSVPFDIEANTFIPPCRGDQVHYQQTDLPGETVNSPLHNQTDNVPASFDAEAGRDVEAGGASSSETSSPNAENRAETSLPMVTRSEPPDDDDDGVDETPPHEDHKVKDKLEFFFKVGGQIIAIGVASFALKNTSSMSSAAMLLQHILIGCMFASLICLFYGLWLSVYKPRSKAARVVWASGYVAMALTLLIATGLCLSNKLMPWVTLGVVIFCLPPIILYARRIV